MKKLYSYVRFSCPKQVTGDSLRRQLKLAEEYAQKHGLELSKITDRGLSGYKGHHLSKGKLGKFLALVDAGKVEKGSVLLIESFDRLSRQEITKALPIFMDIINNDIEVVTLADGAKSYTKDSINHNPTDLLLSIFIMSRANDESAAKSQRLKDVWTEKRNNIKKQKLTSMGPAWLKLVNDEWEICPEKAKVVKEIFKRTLSGEGVNKITATLNERNIPTFSFRKTSTTWHVSYIQKILKNEAVFGRFQPHKFIDGKRTPDGEPIEGYYPAIISKNDFLRVKSMRDSRPKHPGRRREDHANLFSGLVHCGCCNGSMHYVAKGQKGNAHYYLTCSNGRRKAGNCPGNSWQYKKFQSMFLLLVNEIDWESVFTDERRETLLSGLRDRKNVLQEQIKDSEGQLERLVDILAASGAKSEAVLKRITKLEEDAAAMKAELEEVTSKINSFSHDAAKSVPTVLKSYNDASEPNFREKLQAGIAGFVKRIELQPDKSAFELTVSNGEKLTYKVDPRVNRKSGNEFLKAQWGELRKSY